MVFCGIGMVFSTKDEMQYRSIGEFWDTLSKRYGRENLQGLGFGWTEDTITYVIGLKQGILEDACCFPGAHPMEVMLPDSGWMQFSGRTEQLPQLYDRIYLEGPLLYEIESFSEDGSCAIRVIRK